MQYSCNCTFQTTPMSHMQNPGAPIGKAFVIPSLMISSVLMSCKMTSLQETVSCNKIIVEDISTDDKLRTFTPALFMGKSVA